MDCLILKNLPWLIELATTGILLFAAQCICIQGILDRPCTRICDMREGFQLLWSGFKSASRDEPLLLVCVLWLEFKNCLQYILLEEIRGPPVLVVARVVLQSNIMDCGCHPFQNWQVLFWAVTFLLYCLALLHLSSWQSDSPSTILSESLTQPSVSWSMDIIETLILKEQFDY